MSANKYQTNLERMKELIRILNEADIAYYRDDNPIMTDFDYDRLFDELKSLERDTKLILSNSPTQKVSGEILEELTEVRHTKPMLSADKTKSVADLAKFAAEKDVILSWKLDGLTIVIRYENGELVQAITRGREGIIGEDVTHTVKVFLNVPLTVPMKEFKTIVATEALNGIISDIKCSSSYVEEIGAKSYECYIDGFQIDNHYTVMVKEKELQLTPSCIDQVKRIFQPLIHREDFISQIIQWPELETLTDAQYKEMINDPEVPERIASGLSKNDSYWDAYWETISEVAHQIVREYTKGVSK